MDDSILLSSTTSEEVTKTHETIPQSILDTFPPLVKLTSIQSNKIILPDTISTDLYQFQLQPPDNKHIPLIFDLGEDSILFQQIDDESQYFQAKTFINNYRTAIRYLIYNSQYFVANSPSYVLVQEGVDVKIFTQAESIIEMAKEFLMEGFCGLVQQTKHFIQVSRSFAEHFLCFHQFYTIVSSIFSTQVFPYSIYWRENNFNTKKHIGNQTIMLNSIILGKVLKQYIEKVDENFQVDIENFPAIGGRTIYQIEKKSKMYFVGYKLD